jgi:hypothetical protein
MRTLNIIVFVVSESKPTLLLCLEATPSRFVNETFSKVEVNPNVGKLFPFRFNTNYTENDSPRAIFETSRILDPIYCSQVEDRDLELFTDDESGLWLVVKIGFVMMQDLRFALGVINFGKFRMLTEAEVEGSEIEQHYLRCFLKGFDHI